MQCLEVIKEALEDTHLTQAHRLSLVLRARRILQAKTTSRKRKACDSGVVDSQGTTVSFTLQDFPEEELIQAPEVHNYSF